MKNGEIIRLVFTAMAVFTMTSITQAEELVDFDGITGNKSIIKLLDSDYVPMSSENNIQITPKVDNQFTSDIRETVKIKTTLNIGNRIISNEIVCKDDANINTLTLCKNQSSSSPLGLKDIDNYFLSPYFPKDGTPIFMIENLGNELRHSYTNCVNVAAGKQCFKCDDVCKKWITVKREITLSTGEIKIVYEQECRDWSHECNCISNCY